MAIVDLGCACLQIHVDRDFSAFQAVVFKGQRYYRSRLGFGLNISPLAMSAVVREVLGANKNISANTSGFIDHIFVNTSSASVEEVSWHLARYGLECKPAEKVWEETRVLGLKVWGKQGKGLRWKRDNFVSPPEIMTR